MEATSILGSKRRLFTSPRYFLLLLLCLPGPVSAEQQPGAVAASFTQYRINEIAASCVECEDVLSGLTGVRKPGETPAQFAGRIHRYIAALDALVVAVDPIRHAPQPHDVHPENLQRWKRLTEDATRLANEVKLVRAAWQRAPIPSEKAPLGPRLLRSLETVEDILNGLRDARP